MPLRSRESRASHGFRLRVGVPALVMMLLLLSLGIEAGGQCRPSCRQARRACLVQARNHRRALLGDCAGTAAQRRLCRRQARGAARAERAACGSLTHTCRLCCAAGGSDCAAPSTTTTTIRATSTTLPTSTTSTTIAGVPSTTTTLPVACRFPATGQTTCWDGSGNPIACAGTGQDGDVRAGAPLGYTDNGDGTIIDRNTELVWEKLSDDGSVHDVNNHYTWDQAFARVAALNAMSFAGHADWRLPNVKELASIVNYQNHDPAVSAAFNDNCTIGCTVETCSCTGSVDCWSSTTNLSAPPFAWLVSFKTGFADAATKGGSLSVRAVRGGTSCLPATGQTGCWDGGGEVIACAGTGQDGDIRAGVPLSFTDNGDGTVTDDNTGLVWEKLSQDQSIHGDGAGDIWDNAFSVHVATLNGTSFAGHSDWRLPNLRELQGIVNYGGYEPALSSPAFNDNCRPLCTVLTCSCTLKGTYWSSTSVAGNPVAAWSALHARGDMNPVGKSVNDGIRAVRGGG